MKLLAKLVCALLMVSLLAIPIAGCAKPLTLRVTSPVYGATVDKNPLEVRGSVSDYKATVWVNGSVITVSNSGQFSTKLEITEGENSVKITAARGKPGDWKDVVARTISVTYSPK